jgi:hypothetical protein
VAVVLDHAFQVFVTFCIQYGRAAGAYSREATRRSRRP